MLTRRSTARAPLAAILVVACLVAACSSKDEGTQAGGGGTATPKTNPDCKGEPLKFTSIASTSGPLTVPSLVREGRNASIAAVNAVNAECALGRPLEIDICDDKSDPNQAAACGRKANSDGSLALFGSSGGFDTGTTAAKLPGVMTAGGTVFDLTDPRSFSSNSGLTLVVGSGSVATTLKVKDNLTVAVDTAATRSFIETAKQLANANGIKLDTLFVPPDTTDWAPVAAQVSQRKPSSIGLILPSPVPFINALDAEGITPKDVPVFTAVTLVSPEVLDKLGTKADGMYLLTQQAPPSDSSNPGVEQMLKELKDAGVDANGADLSPASTGAWANVHALVDILKKLPRSEIASLDQAKLVDAMKDAGPVDRPEIAPFDFSKPAFPDIPALASLRIYSRDAMLVQVKDGKYVRASDFSDATQPFKLDQ
ncbi:MAG TPA: ABC transporter substrate-binding protein [Acidimicrobiales bacterium]|nr:ABC transporter substrate-binding protein [Acidimicrobiales bacterium]